MINSFLKKKKAQIILPPSEHDPTHTQKKNTKHSENTTIILLYFDEID